MKQAGVLVLVAALAGCGGATTTRSDWETQNAAQLAKADDAAVQPILPAYPAPGDLVEFRVDGFSGYRLYVDASTLSVGDAIVRYTLVARSTSGAENVAYEAINCRSAEMRLLAIGRAGRTWSPQESSWRSIGQRPVQRSLMREYFCPKNFAIASAEEGVSALRRGGHPRADLTGR